MLHTPCDITLMAVLVSCCVSMFPVAACRVLVLLPAGVQLSCMGLKLSMRTSMTTKTTSHASSSWPGESLGTWSWGFEGPSSAGAGRWGSVQAAFGIQGELLLSMM